MDRALSDALPKRELTTDEMQHLNDILDASLAWQNGEIDGNTLLRMGMIEYQGPNDRQPHVSPPYTRYLAMGYGMRFRNPDGTHDPRYLALRDFLDKLVAFKYVVTPQGVLSREEEHQHDHAIRLMRGATLTDRPEAA